jgi:hypothetical protein
MTAIIGIVHDGRTWIGADSCIVDAGIRATSLSPKVWRAGGYLLGVAGNSAWYSIVRRVRWPAVASPGYMLSGVIGDLTSAASELGLELPAAQDSPADGSMLVGGAGKLWYVDSDLASIEYAEVSAGSGDEGLLCALRANPSGSPRTRILRSLAAVASVRIDVMAPFLVESI